MSLLKWFSLTALLAFGMGCIAPERTDSEVRITIQGSYEKKVLTPSGFSGIATRSTRFCFAEVLQASTGQPIASGYLGSDGTGYADVPRGTSCYVRIYAMVEVPNPSGSNFVLRGSVLNALAPGTTATDTEKTSAFQLAEEWFTSSNTFTADSSSTVAVMARTGSSDLSGGAFAIADQMTTFALKTRDLEPNLLLPNLHFYWTTNAYIPRAYPSILFMGSGAVYRMNSGRAVFTGAVAGEQGGAVWAETDEFDDGVLQETFAHLLFADYSSKEDGSSFLPLIRRDNDYVYVSRYRQSESTAAFVGGACDFLAAATLGNGRLMDSYNDGAGVFRVDTFDLAFHDPFLDSSEFTRGSIAVSLWGIYQNSLGGSASGLQTLWNALRSNTRNADDTGEYNRATLACYPSYLLGVKSRVGGTQWNSALFELGLENIPDPSPTYFNGTALYQPINIGQSVNGSVQAYHPDEVLYYERNQSQAYRFTLFSPGTRTIQMTPTGGQDLFLEVLGPDGWEGGSTGGVPGASRSLTLSNLPAGAYAIRVRAGDTTATTNAGFTLTLQ